MCGSVHWGVFSTLGEYHEYVRGVKYIGGYQECTGEGNIMNTLGDVQYIWGYHDACGGYHEYIEGCSVHRDIMSTLADIMSTLGFSIEIERICQVALLNAS